MPRAADGAAGGAAGGLVVVALVIPLQGSAGMFGPSCQLCAELAVAELNTQAGLLGREVRLWVVDGGRAPQRVAAEVLGLVRSGLVQAVVGWHISAVREELAPRIAGRVPYVYTALYEGGERRPGVFLTGETPGRQLLPAMRWLARERGVRRWYVVGNDYIWPRRSARAVRRYARQCGGEVTREVFVPLGSASFTGVVADIARQEPDAVLMLLVGQDAVQFNRAFAAAGLHDRALRLSSLMDENMLLASGAIATKGLCAAAGYFEALPTAGSLDFESRYCGRFGADAPPLNSLGESCYEGIRLLSTLVDRAGSLHVPDLCRTATGAGYDGPRGSVHLRGQHLYQAVYLAEADQLDFNIVTSL